MRSAVEFHDSHVSAVRADGNSLEVTLDRAYVHWSDGVPGTDSGESHIGPVVLRALQPVVQGQLSAFHGRLSDGSVSANGSTLTVVPLPFSSNAPAVLSLVLDSGATLEVYAASVEIASLGPTTFVEPFTG